MKEQNATLVINSAQFVKRLEELGISLDAEKLRTWSKQELISPYKIRYQRRKKKTGRPPNKEKARKEGRILEKARLGRIAEWPEQALEETAAVYAVQTLALRMVEEGTRERKKLSVNEIRKIKDTARGVFMSPQVIHELPYTFDLTTPNPSHIYSFQDLETKVATNRMLNAFAMTWISARAKVRHKTENTASLETMFRDTKVLNDCFNDLVAKTAQLNEDLVDTIFEDDSFNESVITLIDLLLNYIPVKIVVKWQSRLMLAKNPLLKDLPEDDFELALKKEGVLEDYLPENFQLRRIPVKFRNVPDWLLRQECRIPEGSQTLNSFWDRLPASASYEEIDDLLRETTNDWRYLPTGWTFRFVGVELAPSRSSRDELVVFIDGNDSRKKALYAPFSEYNPNDMYDPEHLGRVY